MLFYLLPVQDFNPFHTQQKKKTFGKYLSQPITIPLSVLKEIRSKNDNVKINPLLTTCIVRALNRLAEEKTGSSNPDWTWTVMSPSSLWITEHKLELTNRLALLGGQYTSKDITDWNALTYVQNKLQGPATVPFTWAAYVFAELSGNCLPDESSRVLQQFTAMFSNINGPMKHTYLCGRLVKSIYGYASILKNNG
jgi:hypothetical protein